jgi:hypothetical protein
MGHYPSNSYESMRYDKKRGTNVMDKRCNTGLSLKAGKLSRKHTNSPVEKENEGELPELGLPKFLTAEE